MFECKKVIYAHERLINKVNKNKQLHILKDAYNTYDEIITLNKKTEVFVNSIIKDSNKIK